ncbi:MAG: hypothetical protein AAF204_00660 [Pseudomonadota bacterium]
MPNIIFEYTDTLNIDVPTVLTTLHKTLSEQETIDIHAIKTRAIPVLYTIVGDGHEPDKFIHINLRLLPGRDDALKKTMAKALHDAARSCCIKDDRISISVEVSELHEPSYTKSGYAKE